MSYEDMCIREMARERAESNKAQHSPPVVYSKTLRTIHVRPKFNVAEALRDIETLAQCTVPPANIAGHLRAIENKAQQALAEYEADRA